MIDIVKMRAKSRGYSASTWVIRNRSVLQKIANVDLYFRAGSTIPAIGDDVSIVIPDMLYGRPIAVDPGIETDIVLRSAMEAELAQGE